MARHRLRRFFDRLLGRPPPPPKARPPYRYRPGDTVVDDFAEFSGQTVQVIEERINDFQRINAADWNALGPTGFAERSKAFYEASQNYVYDLLSANPRPEAVLEKLDACSPRLVQAIREHPGRRFLEFGGGLGVFCELVAGMGKEVHYLDIPGLVSRFATWRFEKHGLRIPFICADPGRIHVPSEYDAVLTDAVLEHLPAPLQLEASTAIGRAVAPGGVLVFLVDLTPPGPDFPMHHPVDIRALHRALRDTGLGCELGRDKFWSLWRRA